MEDDSAYDIAVARVSGCAPECEARLRDAIESTLRRHQTLEARISVAVVDDTHIANLNRLHLNQEGATDVMAFDLRDNELERDSHLAPSRMGEGIRASGNRGSERRAGAHGLQSVGSDPVSHSHVEGEIIVSADTAAREAHGRGHSFEAELALYVVHGTLHLLGYDDHDQEAADRMHEIEDEILTKLGVGAVYGTNR